MIYPKYSELKKILDYNPTLGCLIWKQDRNIKTKKGMEAGSTCKRTITIDGVNYSYPKICYLMHYKKLPKKRICFLDGDHENTIPSNMLDGYSRPKDLGGCCWSISPAYEKMLVIQEMKFFWQRDKNSSELIIALKDYLQRHWRNAMANYTIKRWDIIARQRLEAA